MENKSDLVTYLHRCCYSPTTSSWLKAIKNGFFTTWPGLDETIVHNKSSQVSRNHQRPSTTAIQKPAVHVTRARKGEFRRTPPNGIHQRSIRPEAPRILVKDEASIRFFGILFQVTCGAVFIINFTLLF
jgi:hypothetical protein